MPLSQLVGIIITISIPLIGVGGIIWWKIAQLETSKQYLEKLIDQNYKKLEDDLKAVKSELKDMQNILVRLDVLAEYLNNNKK